jgi:multidrug resistance efflux pump
MKQKMHKLINSVLGKIIIFCLIIFTIVGGSLFYLLTNHRVKTDSAQVQTPIVNVVPDTAGHLLETYVNEGDKVSKGDILALTDTGNIKSYTDGYVIKVNQQIGALFSSQTPIVETIDPSQSRIVGEVDENKGLSQIKAGQVASFTVDALPGKQFFGYVDEISPTAEEDSLSFSISNTRPTRKFKVYIKFDSQKYSEIKNGMSAKLVIFTKD